jgi:hypothetical protein
MEKKYFWDLMKIVSCGVDLLVGKGRWKSALFYLLKIAKHSRCPLMAWRKNLPLEFHEN